MSNLTGMLIALLMGVAGSTAWAQNGGYRAEYCQQVMSETEMRALRERLAEAESDEEKTEVLWENLEMAIRRAREMPEGTGGRDCAFGT